MSNLVVGLIGAGPESPARLLAESEIAAGFPSSNRQTLAVGRRPPMDGLSLVVADGGVSSKSSFESSGFEI
jgi:hypothetical protein